MPDVGEITNGSRIGKSGNRYIWTRCGDCGKERWAQYNPANPSSSRRCKPCHIAHIAGRFKLRGSDQ
jgi:hypothetical protein